MHRQRIELWSYTADAKNIDDRRNSYAETFENEKGCLGRSGIMVAEHWTSADYLSFAHGLHDDPAFSADPHSNPFFASSHDIWSPPIVTALQGASHPPVRDSDDSHFVQLNNSSMWVDDSTTSHESSSTDWHHSSTSASSHSTTPTSNESHFLPPYLPHAVGTEQLEKSAPWPLNEKKKRASMSLFWRRGQTEVDIPEPTPLSKDQPLDHKQGPPPPSLDAFKTERPAAPHIYAKPGLIKTPERSPIPNRLATSAAEAKLPPTAARRVVGGIALNAHELDRIDELDESNPFGASLHHNGPYEAVFKSSQEETPSQSQEEHKILHNIGDQYKLFDSVGILDLKKQPKKEKSRSSSRPRPPPDAPVPYVPAGISLNLAPGQILRYDFKYGQTLPDGQIEQNNSLVPQPPLERRIINGLSERDDQRRRTHTISSSMDTRRDHAYYYDDGHAYNEPSSSRRSAYPGESSFRRDSRSSAPQVVSTFTELVPAQLPSYQASISQSGSQSWQPIIETKQAPGIVNSPAVERPPNHRSHNHSRLPPRMQALQRDKREKARQQQQQATEESRQLQQQQQRRQLEFDVQSRNVHIDEGTVASMQALHIDGDTRANLQQFALPQQQIHGWNNSGVVLGSGDVLQGPGVTTPPMLALDYHVTPMQPQSRLSAISRSHTPQLQKAHELLSSRSNSNIHSSFVGGGTSEADQPQIQQQQAIIAMHTGNSVLPGSPAPSHGPSIREMDARSLHPSLAGSGGSMGSSSFHYNPRPQPLHVPKRLVMPTPLQQAEQPPVAPPRQQSQTTRSGPTYVHHWPPRLPQDPDQLDSEAQGYKLPPQLRQEVPMNQQRSGKLRKRSSVQVTPIYDGH